MDMLSPDDGFDDHDDKMVFRETPEPDQARRALVKRWQDDVQNARSHWKADYERMRRDILFAAGQQWPDQESVDDKRYRANIILRHISQRVATLYARNPRVVSRRRPRLMCTVWDQTGASLQKAVEAFAQNPLDNYAKAVIEDARMLREHNLKMDRIAQTLEHLFDHELREQSQPFKTQIKSTLRRAATVGVGFMKIGFQRIMEPTPDGERAIADAQERLSTLERLAVDVADGEIDPNAAEMEQLRLLLNDLTDPKNEIVVREGLTFDTPDSNAIIPDTRCRSLRGFIGCSFVAEQYLLSTDQVQEIWGVDVSSCHTSYDPVSMQPGEARSMIGSSNSGEAKGLACVWQIYNRPDGLVYTVCDGHPDFLGEPASPDVEIEGFWPWRALFWNETYQPGNPWPISDVSLTRDMQLDYNRGRQGLREHRHANRPKMVVSSAAGLSEDDEAKLQHHPAHALIKLDGLQPGQAVDQLLMPLKMSGIDPNLYDPNAAFTDIQRVVGTSEANLGGTSGATATESSIAEASRGTASDSAVDDLDEMLTDFARIGSQILLLNMSRASVQRVVGPGAIWPEATARDAADELYLEVEAGSSGRPDGQRELQRWTQAVPVLAQIPGVNPEWIAKQLLTRLDEHVDLGEAFLEGLPSIAAMNQMAAAKIQEMVTGAMGGSAPAQQGRQGAANGPVMPSGQGGEGPRMPAPRDHGAAAGGFQLEN